MSSNIKVQRICQHCGKEFTARTTVTRYCSEVCAKRAYKVDVRNKKVESSNTETQLIRDKPILDLQKLEFLSVSQVAKLIGSSRQMIYHLINDGKLKAIKVSVKKTIIKRVDLEEFFQQKRPINTLELNKNLVVQFNPTDFYNLNEVELKYGISNRALYELIKRNKILKIKENGRTYIFKEQIDKLLT